MCRENPVPPDDLDPTLRELIRAAARRLSFRSGFQRHEAEDLEQELARRLLDGLRRYDPAAGGRGAFAGVIVRNAVANLLRDRRARKRRDHRTVRLEVPDTTDQRRSVGARSAEEQSDLRQDVAAVLGKLSAQDCDLAERVVKTNVAQAARDLGVPRTTVAEQLRRLRARFERAGLRQYL